MGLFDVNMPMLYGEGHKAFRRLQEEIIRTSDDHSIFAWSCDGDGPRDLLASSPACFTGCANIMRPPIIQPEQFSLTNVDLSISLLIMRQNVSTYVALLNCWTRASTYRIGIFLRVVGHGLFNALIRFSSSGKDITYIKEANPDEYERRTILIVPRPDSRHLSYQLEYLHGFVTRLASNPLFGVTTNGKVRFRLSGYASVKKELFDNQHVLRATFADGPQWLKMDFMVPGNTGPIGRIFFGFSFDLDPACLLVSRDQASVDLAKESSEGVFVGHLFKTRRWIEEKIELHLVQAPDLFNGLEPLRVDQPIDSYCALRGHIFNGLDARIKHLNTRIEIQPWPWKQAYRQAYPVHAWTVHTWHLK
jgi:hypothetical protein